MVSPRVMSELESVVARKATILNPTEDDETVKILRRRLFERIDDAHAAEIVRAYGELWSRHRQAVPETGVADERLESFAAGYPLHPELIETLREKTSSIPDFQRVRGMLRLLGRSGRMVIVGALTPMPGFVGASLIWWNRAVGGSAIGGIPETQEMLDFCAAKGIYPDVEMIRMSEVNTAYERLLKNDVRYRFVIDMSQGL